MQEKIDGASTDRKLQEPVKWETLTDSQIMASVGRHAGGEKTSISESRPLGRQWEQVCELVRKIIGERYSAMVGQPAPVQFDVSIDDDKAKFLWDMLGEDREDLCDVRLLAGQGHSGYGLYVASADYPEEGAELLATITPPEAQSALKPLTDEQIEDLCWTEVDQRLRSFARAIEAAHGIKGRA